MSQEISERAARLERLQKIKNANLNPYPSQVKRNYTIKEFLNLFDTFSSDTKIEIVGRIRSIRKHGGMTFLHLEDGTDRVQVIFQAHVLGTSQYEFLLDILDIGDFMNIYGCPFLTKTGEKTVQAREAKIITKTLRPLPEKWHGLTDTEIRYRKRYLDLLANSSVREIFHRRSEIVKLLRRFFDERGFLEVETPILQPIPGGALARPFVTHHNALDIDLYLRIAPELYLKRLIVGGFEKVYEIARCFRNEGIDPQHNPEFTQIEFYQAYSDYHDLMNLTEELLPYLLEGLGLGLKIVYQGEEINFTPPYPRLSYRDVLKTYTGLDIEEYEKTSLLFEKAKSLGCDLPSNASRGKIIDELFKTFVRPKIIQPTFIINHPIELSPLAKRIEDNPKYVERFQLVVGKGIELINAFSELNDPLDQRERFEEQEKARAAGEEEVQRMDEDFIEALEYGMPPTAGFGMGIDRLAALLTNSYSLKEVILFPTLRPEK
jgi:lysyl-tRNA synthetase class 2